MRATGLRLGGLLSRISQRWRLATLRPRRPALVLLHRWVGLGLAGFLLLAGITGALLVWYPALDAALNPGLMQVQAPAAASPGLDRLALRERVQQQWPGSQVHWVPLQPLAPTQALVFWIEAGPGQPALAFDEVFVDPYTGQILGTRHWGEIRQGLSNLMPFIHLLHQQLALGPVGVWVFGVVALLWTLDSLVALWLTWPARARPRGPQGTPAMAAPRPAGPGWWQRWAPAWRVRWAAGGYRRLYDLHRAGGLWPWLLMLLLAWSSVAFNLYEPVYRPVMGLFFNFQPDPRASLPRLAQPQPDPRMGWAAGLAAARAEMAALAQREHLQLLQEDRFSYDPRRGVLRLEVMSSRDVSRRRGRSAVFVSADDGRLLAWRLPTGQANGDTVTAWLLNLHMGHVGG